MLKLPHHKRKIIIATVIALALAAGGGWYIYAKQNNSSTNKTPGQYNPGYFNPDKNVPKPDKKSSDQSSDNSTAAEKGDSSSDSTNTNSSVQPKKPVGTFVSNHYPPPNQESSTCLTTAGVTCQIRFTKGSVTKKLPAKTTNSNGNASWAWTIQGVGLTSGTWKVSAVATNGNKTATAYDALNLVVK